MQRLYGGMITIQHRAVTKINLLKKMYYMFKDIQNYRMHVLQKLAKKKKNPRYISDSGTWQFYWKAWLSYHCH